MTKQPDDTSMNLTRNHYMHDFLNTHLKSQSYKVHSLLGDASFRRYHRIILDSSNQGISSYMLMDAPPEQESVDSFVQVAQLFDSVVNVPSILAQDMPQGFLLLQDFGDIEFAHLLKQAKKSGNDQRLNQLYHWALDTLLALQALPIDEIALPQYDQVRLHNEMDLFSDWLLPYLNVPLNVSERDMWQATKISIGRKVATQPNVVVHRDYHSRNLMQDQYQVGRLGIIDFQDAVIGPYTYDVVSLLRDAYVDWSETQIQAWAKYYHQGWQAHAQHEYQRDWQTFLCDMNIMGVQRHLKVLGIFVRLAQRDGKIRYLSDIPKVWQDLTLELEWLTEHADESTRKEFVPFCEWITQSVAPNFKRVFGV